MQNESEFTEIASMELRHMEESVEKQKALLVKNVKDLYDYVEERKMETLNKDGASTLGKLLIHVCFKRKQR